jgi:hypothetical protein
MSLVDYLLEPADQPADAPTPTYVARGPATSHVAYTCVAYTQVTE